jgi:Ran-binding protein 3
MAAADTEGAEKPVREQLKKASIGGMSDEARDAAQELKMAQEDSSVHGEEAVAEGEPIKLDEKKDNEETGAAGQSEAPIHLRHTRKRSRDSTAEDDNEHKRKISGERSRAQSPTVEANLVNGAAKPKGGDRSTTPEPAANKTATTEEAVVSPKVKRSKISGETEAAENENQTTTETLKIPPGSGFANTSAASPFGSLATKKSPPATEQPQTSASAFAASGFGSLAGSSNSGFGAVGKSSGGFGSGGAFGSGSKSPLGGQPSEENTKPAGSSFGGALGQKSAFAAPASSSSGFGSGASGFGKIGQSSGLGSGLGGSGFGSGAGGLSSFASGKSTPLSGAVKQQKTSFGAPADDDDDGDNDAADDDTTGGKSPLPVEEDEKDERFFAQDIETGEEDETTEYSCRAKLYNYSTLPDGKKEWRERGLGMLRLNVNAGYDGDENSKPKARFLMRADGSHRVVLNTPIKKEIKFGTPSGEAPKNGFIYFMGTFEGSSNLEMLQIKVRTSCCDVRLHRKLTHQTG